MGNQLSDYWHGEFILKHFPSPRRTCNMTWFCINLLLTIVHSWLPFAFTVLLGPPAGRIRVELLHFPAPFISSISSCIAVQLYHLLYLPDEEKGCDVCVSSTSTKEFVGVKGVVSKTKYRQEMVEISAVGRAVTESSVLKNNFYRPLQILQCVSAQGGREYVHLFSFVQKKRGYSSV